MAQAAPMAQAMPTLQAYADAAGPTGQIAGIPLSVTLTE